MKPSKMRFANIVCCLLEPYIAELLLLLLHILWPVFANGLTWGSVELQGKWRQFNLPAGRPLQPRGTFLFFLLRNRSSMFLIRSFSEKSGEGRENSDSKIEIITKTAFQVNQKPTQCNETEKHQET